jgi:alkylhydroperoxidase family enzyme
LAQVRHLAAGPTELDQAWGVRPAFYSVFMADYRASVTRVEPVLLELCRLRLAQLLDGDFDRSLRYEPAIAAGLTEEKLRALADYGTSPQFSETERLCLSFAELFVIQSSNIGDEDVARVQQALGPEQFIYFVKALSVIDQLQRSVVAFDVRPGPVVPAALSDFRPAPAA